MKIARPALLMSVRDDREFDQLLWHHQKGRPLADIIDLKDPSSGPLAPAPVGLWRHAAVQADSVRTARLSLALGEYDQAIAIAGDVPQRFDYAKMGPSRCKDTEQLVDRWQEIQCRLPASVELVAVAYADHRAAECPSVQAVLEAAAGCAIRRVLIDTFAKNGQRVFDHLSISQLKKIGQQMDDRGGWWALAGAINSTVWLHLEASDWTPDCLGIRGALCHQDRQSELSLEKCERWLQDRDAYCDRVTTQDCSAPSQTG